MGEIKKITNKNYYISCISNIGIYETEPGRVWLIDGGGDANEARRILELTARMGWSVDAVIATTGLSMNMGGCCFLSKESGCRVYAAGGAVGFIRDNSLAPAMLYGAKPPDTARNKFLEAQSCECSELTQNILPGGMEIVPLPGFFSDMIGVRTLEGVFYCSGSVVSSGAIKKGAIRYMFDIDRAMRTLAALPYMEADFWLPANTELTTDISELAWENLNDIRRIQQSIIEICRYPVRLDRIIEKLCALRGISLDFSGYTHTERAVCAHLYYLINENRLRAWTKNNNLLWQAL